MRLASDRMGASYDATATRPIDELGTEPAPPEAQEPRPLAHSSRRHERRAELLIAGWFVFSVAGSLLFCAAYLFVDLHAPDLGRLQNLLLGTGLGCATAGIALGLVTISKTLAPGVTAVQHRPEHHSDERDEIAAEQQVLGGVTEIGLSQRRLVRRTMLAAFATVPLPFLFALRDTGPRPGRSLQTNAWYRDARLVDADTGKPVKLGDVDIGGIATVVPEHRTDTLEPVLAESVVILIHLPPGENQPRPGRESWAPDDHVAYSKICTHAGCAVGLFEQQTNHLLCPCHQSTFDAANGCKVVFGPAARALPQLPIYVDPDGYFRAQRPFDVPLGPSFWERSAK